MKKFNQFCLVSLLERNLNFNVNICTFLRQQQRRTIFSLLAFNALFAGSRDAQKEIGKGEICFEIYNTTNVFVNRRKSTVKFMRHANCQL